MMDCDNNGIEPDLALKKTKKLVGGGTMSIVNQTVPRALRKLGYSEEQITAIVAYIDENSHVVGAPHLKEEHMTVFDTAMGERTIHYMGHIKMMAAAQPFLSGAISKCVTGNTLLTTGEGLIRIKSLYEGEAPDVFRDRVLEVASNGGTRKTDAFYFGGRKPVRKIKLRSGHAVTGTGNHRVQVAGKGALEWRRLDEIEVGEYVATQYGTDLWSDTPAFFHDFQPSPKYGRAKDVSVPSQMTEELAFLLGAFVAEGHISRSNWTITITNSVDSVLERVKAAWKSELGVEARIVRQPGKCPGVVVSAKRIVEFLDYLVCGHRASCKRIPDAVLCSPRSMVLSFLRGLFLDAYAHPGAGAKVGICVDSPELLDDLQAVLTNLGIFHSRVTKHNSLNGKDYDEVYATGEWAKALIGLVPFMEPDKAARADRLVAQPFQQSTADVVPGISGRELYELIPKSISGRNGRSQRREWTFLLDPRTQHVSRSTLQRLAAKPGIELPAWVMAILDDRLHFSPVVTAEDAGEEDVFDISVPTTHAFVGNGIVNHNTVNLPENVTVEDVEQVYIEGWRLGLKAMALYRDNCKVAQPLSTAKKGDHKAEVVETPQPVRRRLPKARRSMTFKFRVADTEGYLTAGEFPDGGVGELFLRVAKQGSTLAGIMDAFAISISMGLQYGVPLSAYVKQFANTRFEPSGMTDDPELRIATSILDYVFRRLAIEYLAPDERHALGIRTAGERQAEIEAKLDPASEVTHTNGDGNGHSNGGSKKDEVIVLGPVASATMGSRPFCGTCGIEMIPAGSCFACTSCGSTSGCS
jgi:intein/homing endonuclease